MFIFLLNKKEKKKEVQMKNNMEYEFVSIETIALRFGFTHNISI